MRSAKRLERSWRNTITPTINIKPWEEAQLRLESRKFYRQSNIIKVVKQSQQIA